MLPSSTQHTDRYIHANWTERQSLMHVTHVQVTQLNQAVKCAGALLPMHGGPAASRRSGFRRLFPASHVLLDFFFSWCCRHKANRCQYLLSHRRGRIRRKELHHNQPLQIFSFSHGLQKARDISRWQPPPPLRVGSIHPFLDFNHTSLLDTLACSWSSPCHVTRHFIVQSRTD